jgi:4a-hydroxytetrahydrobiopterin dehydratase
MTQKLTPEDVQAALLALPHWLLEDGSITRTLVFPTFPEAIDFVNQVAFLAEEANHHPDIDIRYNKLRIVLSTHDAGGLTSKDFALAAALNRALTTN